jgi:hypothetical protein
MLLTRILEVLSSNLGWDTNVTEVYQGLPQYLQVTASKDASNFVTTISFHILSSSFTDHSTSQCYSWDY